MLPVLAAVVVGAALASAGSVMQSVLRNPLAEPYLLGLVGGAALFAAVAIHFGVTSWPVVPAFAFAGACFSLALVAAVSLLAAKRRGGAVSGETVVLAGFVTGGFTGSMEMVVLNFAEPETYKLLSTWLFGDLHSVRPAAFAAAAALAAVAIAVMYSQNRNLNALALGPESAASVGVNVRRTLFVTLGAASLATAASVSIAGAIGFLGLVVPHAVRRLFGANHRLGIPVAAVVGAVVLIAADAIGSAVPRGGLSAGVVCALVGAPFFLYLLVLRPR